MAQWVNNPPVTGDRHTGSIPGLGIFQEHGGATKPVHNY